MGVIQSTNDGEKKGPRAIFPKKRGAIMSDEATREHLWKQYNVHVDLYKFYLDIGLKANAFFYAITGGILSFYLAHSKEPLMKFALILPVAMSLVLAALFFYGASRLGVTRKDEERLLKELELGVAVEINLLTHFLRGSAVILLLVAAAIVYLLCR
jgi:hypothetical protein